VGVITKLLTNSSDALRRKAVELVNAHIQALRAGFSDEEKKSLLGLVTPLVNVATLKPNASQEQQIIQQSALLSLRLLAKVLAAENVDVFKKVSKVKQWYFLYQVISLSLPSYSSLLALNKRKHLGFH